MEQVEFDLPASIRMALDRLEAAGYPSYVVGGAVRDQLAGKQPLHAADVGVDGHGIVVEDDNQRLAALSGVAQALIGQPAGERSVADEGDDVLVPPGERARTRHAQRYRDGVGGMPGDERVVQALRRLGKAGDAIGLTQAFEGVHASGEQLVHVALVPHVEHKPVLRRVEYAVDGHRQLHGPQIGGQVPAGL